MYFIILNLSLEEWVSTMIRGACGIVFAGGYDTTTTQMIREIGEFTPNHEVEERIESEVNIQMGSYMQVDRTRINKIGRVDIDLQKNIKRIC